MLTNDWSLARRSSVSVPRLVIATLPVAGAVSTRDSARLVTRMADCDEAVMSPVRSMLPVPATSMGRVAPVSVSAALPYRSYPMAAKPAGAAPLIVASPRTR